MHHYTTGRSLLALSALYIAATTGQAMAEDTISLHFNERPPYIKAQADGSASGLTATPAAEAFKKAGVPFNWVKTPGGDQLTLIEANKGKDCAVGWYKNAKREAFAKFSKPLYRDKPLGALASTHFDVVPGTKLADLLADKKTHVLVKEEYSYGPFVDGLLAKLKPTVVSTKAESVPMVQMVKAGQADLMFVSQEEAAYFVKLAALSSNDLKLLSFPDVPQGEYRYIMCSKQVSDDVMARLDKSLGE